MVLTCCGVRSLVPAEYAAPAHQSLNTVGAAERGCGYAGAELQPCLMPLPGLMEGGGLTGGRSSLAEVLSR